jgi:hypothetical protein
MPSHTTGQPAHGRQKRAVGSGVHKRTSALPSLPFRLAFFFPPSPPCNLAALRFGDRAASSFSSPLIFCTATSDRINASRRLTGNISAAPELPLCSISRSWLACPSGCDTSAYAVPAHMHRGAVNHMRHKTGTAASELRMRRVGCGAFGCLTSVHCDVCHLRRSKQQQPLVLSKHILDITEQMRPPESCNLAPSATSSPTPHTDPSTSLRS